MIKELKYDLTKEDMEKSLSALNNISNKGITKLQIFGFLIILFLAIILSILTGMFLFSSIIIILFLILMLLPKGNKSFVKILGKYETQKFNIIINSDKNTFTNKNDVSTTVVNWDKILKIDNTKDSLLIFTAKNMAFIIPKRIFESEQDMNETWELIQECYNKNKQ